MTFWEGSGVVEMRGGGRRKDAENAKKLPQPTSEWSHMRPPSMATSLDAGKDKGRRKRLRNRKEEKGGVKGE